MSDKLPSHKAFTKLATYIVMLKDLAFIKYSIYIVSYIFSFNTLIYSIAFRLESKT